MSDSDLRPESGTPEGETPPGRRLPTPGLDPDQSCFGCLIWIGILIVTFGFWGWIYWANNPEFQRN